MEKTTRRLTTGINLKNNESHIIADESAKWFIPYDKCPSFQIQELFYSEDCPLSLTTRHLVKDYDIDLPEKAIRFLKLRMPTKAEIIADLTRAGEPVPEDWHKFNLHRTDSIDYIYILSGNITCVVGAEITELSAGDFLVQISPEHTWLNDSNEPCYILCVMIGIATANTEERRKTTF
jgi:mannose-6-phosphate isomerase-like protein (cupin superfamily)